MNGGSAGPGQLMRTNTLEYECNQGTSNKNGFLTHSCFVCTGGTFEVRKSIMTLIASYFYFLIPLQETRVQPLIPTLFTAMMINSVELCAFRKIYIHFRNSSSFHSYPSHFKTEITSAHNSNNRLLHRWARMICITRWHKWCSVAGRFFLQAILNTWPFFFFLQHFLNTEHSSEDPWILFSHTWIIWIIHFSYLAELVENVTAIVSVTEEADAPSAHHKYWILQDGNNSSASVLLVSSTWQVDTPAVL